MNTSRFLSLPNILKPVLLILTLIIVIIVGVSKIKEGEHATGSWFFWLNIIIQLVWTFVVCVFFLMGIESLITCGRSAWPLCETVYSAIFFVCNLINTFLVANWVGKSDDSSGALVAAALIAFVMMVLYALGGVMMFRLYRGFVQSGAQQNPTGDVQPGTIGQMHPGV
uniref:MARVEL domain-containing protein n=1 Tax=Acrobeloides nanus TaxID=290746 RepID=A0A914CPU2_9BILA